MLPPSFSTKHDSGRNYKDNYICYELEAILTRPKSTFSFLSLPLKHTLDLQFSPSRVIEHPDPEIYCRARNFTCQSRQLHSSTAGLPSSLKDKARALWVHNDHPKSTFTIKAEAKIPQAGYISGPLDVSLGIEHDLANSMVTALPPFYLNRVRVSLVATTYARCQRSMIFGGQEKTQPFNTNFTMLDHRFSQTPIAENMHLMQLCPAMRLGRELAPSFSTYNLAREYRLEVKVTVECAGKTFRADFGVVCSWSCLRSASPRVDIPTEMVQQV